MRHNAPLLADNTIQPLDTGYVQALAPSLHTRGGADKEAVKRCKCLLVGVRASTSVGVHIGDNVCVCVRERVHTHIYLHIHNKPRQREQHNACK